MPLERCRANICYQAAWPSGLRRWLQAPVRKGVGSNPTAVIFCRRLALHAALLLLHINRRREGAKKMTAVGFEPTQLALVELESTPLDHSGKLSCNTWWQWLGYRVRGVIICLTFYLNV